MNQSTDMKHPLMNNKQKSQYASLQSQSRDLAKSKVSDGPASIVAGGAKGRLERDSFDQRQDSLN